MPRLPALALVLLCACGDDASPAARAVPVTDAAQLEQLEQPADASAPQERTAPDAGTVEQDSAVAALPDAGTHDGGAVAPVDAGRVVPVVTEKQASAVVMPLCADCHTAVTWKADPALPILEAGGQFRVPQETSSCDGMPYVVPGHPESSYLYLALTAQSPCERHVAVDGLTGEKLQLLADWISGMPAK